MYRTAGRAGGKAIVLSAIAIAVVIAIGLIGVYGFGWFQRSTADFRGETAALEDIQADPNSRISAYNHFFSLCQSIQSHETTIKSLEAELEQGVSDSRKEQIRGAITANKSQRDSKINEYNSDARRDYTVGQFRDADLPSELDISAEETTCVTSGS